MGPSDDESVGVSGVMYSSSSSSSASSTNAGKGPVRQAFTCCANFFSALCLSLHSVRQATQHCGRHLVILTVPAWKSISGLCFVEPGHPKNHALLPKSCDRKQDAFRVAIVGHDHVNYFVDASSFVQRSIYIVNRDRLEQLLCWQFGLVDKILINKVSSCTSVNHGLSGSLFHGVCHLKVG